jgi:hypothetical protein
MLKYLLECERLPLFVHICYVVMIKKKVFSNADYLPVHHFTLFMVVPSAHGKP